MIVTVASRHMEVSAALKTYAQEKAGKLNKYYDRISEIEVIIDKETAELMRVEMVVSAEHNHRIIAHHSQDSAYACVDACCDKLERQLTDHKERHRNRKHPEA